MINEVEPKASEPPEKLDWFSPDLFIGHGFRDATTRSTFPWGLRAHTSNSAYLAADSKYLEFIKSLLPLDIWGGQEMHTGQWRYLAYETLLLLGASLPHIVTVNLNYCKYPEADVASCIENAQSEMRLFLHVARIAFSITADEHEHITKILSGFTKPKPSLVLPLDVRFRAIALRYSWDTKQLGLVGSSAKKSISQFAARSLWLLRTEILLLSRAFLTYNAKANNR